MIPYFEQKHTELNTSYGRQALLSHVCGCILNPFWIFPFCTLLLKNKPPSSRYLDHVGQRIQSYIDAKEKLIAQLQEARQATIQRAVTRGLDPSVPLKALRRRVGWGMCLRIGRCGGCDILPILQLVSVIQSTGKTMATIHFSFALRKWRELTLGLSTEKRS